ncbi:MAG TPA: SRPBCC family protein [Sporichthya sp.]|jgi:carbon monoxide dehydrogenase subunit G|nr:SRPBCC family protein [Sporichthya sp.]
MELQNEFTVGVAVDKAWALLTDLEQIAPCMPGAKLEGVEGENYLGLVKVKVGPITMSYKGTASFVERDDEKYRAVLRAEGRDTRGQGNAAALITAQLEPDGDRTKVTVVTDLNITGKVAQFGRGALADVSSKLLGQFVDRLEADLLGDKPAVTQPTSATGTTAASGEVPTTRASLRAELPDPEPVDLFATVGVPRAVRVGVPVFVLALVALWVRGRRRKS